jgi:hypothetical protein
LGNWGIRELGDLGIGFLLGTWNFSLGTSVAEPVEEGEVGVGGGDLEVVGAAGGGEGAEGADVILDVVFPSLAEGLGVDDEFFAGFHVDEAGEAAVAEVEFGGV